MSNVSVSSLSNLIPVIMTHIKMPAKLSAKKNELSHSSLVWNSVSKRVCISVCMRRLTQLLSLSSGAQGSQKFKWSFKKNKHLLQSY